MPLKDLLARAAYDAERRKRPEALAAARLRRAARRSETNARAARYRAANRELLRERARAYRMANPEKIAEGISRWYAMHADSERAKARERGRAHAETRREQLAAWKARNPLRVAALGAAKSANHRAMARGIPGRLKADDLEALWSEQPRCVDCGLECRGVDHVVEMADGGPNTPDNLANRCLSCNVKKTHRARAARKAAA